MQDFFAEQENRKNQRLAEIGDMTYKRYKAVKNIEISREQIEDLDIGIVECEAAIREIDQSQRNFDSWLAVKEGAMTLDDLGEIIQAGDTDGTEPTGAIDGAEPPKSEPT